MSLRTLSASIGKRCLKSSTLYASLFPRFLATNAELKQREGWLFIDSVFPVRLIPWDLRHYIGIFREETLLSRLEAILSPVDTHNFEIKAIEPHHKDGGVFVRFGYTPDWQKPVEAISTRETKAAKVAADNLSDAAKLGDAAALEDAAEAHAAAKEKATIASQAADLTEEEIDARALKAIERDLRAQVQRKGGIPSWLGIPGRGDVWNVKGRPWREDMSRFASPYVKFAFEGPDVNEEVLYDALRPYGRIKDLTPPVPVPAGALRSTTVVFRHTRSATIARNCIHGVDLNPKGKKSDDKSSTDEPAPRTRLRTSYEQPLQGHAVRDWLSSHPKIVLPIVVFLLGSLTYTIFDPIRSLMVQGKMLNWFDYREFTLYKWVRAHALDQFNGGAGMNSAAPDDIWKDRQEAQTAIHNYLNDLPNTIAFISGPQGSGKTRMLRAMLADTDRASILIDCRELEKASTDMGIVDGLARQTGYWPVFTFLNSMNSLIDLASVGLIGQKAGMSSSLTEQLHQILGVVGEGLKGVSSSHRSAIQRQIHREHTKDIKNAEENLRRERVRRGTYHDGRIDEVAGNGIMSELGIGDEMMDSDWGNAKEEDLNKEAAAEKKRASEEENKRKQRSAEDMQAVASLPIVVIRNYSSKGGALQEELLRVLAEWGAGLAENQIAHVLVLSDNRENSKRLAKALPSKPLNSITLYDADSKSALSFVKQKLQDAGVDLDYTAKETSAVERLGGRASDLESLIHKVRAGQQVEEAVEDIIHRGIGELRKNAFGDDLEDAKNLTWSREQAWTVLKQLSKKPEISYHDVLLEFPFKGDEAALRGMEHSELITISTQHNGRPATIKPGKPVYRYVFERLVEDTVFQATMDIAYNDKLIAASEKTIRTCEEELLTLKEIGLEASWWGSSSRARFLMARMKKAEEKIEAADKKTTELKRLLKKV